MPPRSIKSVEGLSTDKLNELLLSPLGVKRAGREAALSRALDVFDRGGRNYKKDPVRWAKERASVELWSKQRAIIESIRDHPQTAVHSCHAIGKALSLDTEIPTPCGWRDMGSLVVGDQVYDEHGVVCSVVAVSQVWNLPSYRVTLSDGTEIVTSGNHEWNVRAAQDRNKAPRCIDWRDYWSLTRVKTTEQLMNDLSWQGKNYGAKWFIPATRAVSGDESVELAIPPYLLGIWLGDGSKTVGAFVTHVDDVEDITAHIDWPWRYGHNSSTDNVRNIVLPGLIGELRELGLYDNKHIPDVYMRAGIEARRELLRGLMDSDGHVSKTNTRRIDIGFKSKRLADDTYELMTSLGLIVRRNERRATLYGKDCGAFYTMGGTADFEPFHLKRKLSRWRPQRNVGTIRAITSIVEIKSVPTVCIEVDSPSHLFLATRSYVPTHNSFVAATTVAWWLDVHPVSEAFVVTTAPTDKQVKAVLWREINRLHTRAGLAGRTNLSEWYIGKELVAFGRKPADQDPTAFQGIHARYVLLVLDEACGIPKELWDAGSSIVSNEHSRTLAIGNPDDSFGEFAANCRPGNGWNIIHVGYKHTPNFTGEKVSEIVHDSLIAPRWVEERKKKWGQGSAIFTSKCEGNFPLEGTSGTIPYAWVIACRDLELPEGLHDVVEAGIDVGAGGDRTVIRERRGLRAGREEVFVDADPMRSIGRLIEKINEWGVTRVKVDNIGIGWALTGRLQELSSIHNPSGALAGDTSHSAEVVGVNFGEKPTEGREKQYLNKRAEVYWTVGREYSRLRRWDLGAIDDDVVAELTVSTYEILDSFGKIKIEPKDKIIERLGESPDRAEALLLAFYDAHMQVGTPMQSMGVDLLRGNAGPAPGGYRGGITRESLLNGVGEILQNGPLGGGRW